MPATASMAHLACTLSLSANHVSLSSFAPRPRGSNLHGSRRLPWDPCKPSAASSLSCQAAHNKSSIQNKHEGTHPKSPGSSPFKWAGGSDPGPRRRRILENAYLKLVVLQAGMQARRACLAVVTQGFSVQCSKGIARRGSTHLAATSRALP